MSLKVRRDRRIEESLPTQEDKKKFRHLRQEILAGEAVVEELVALEMLVSRGSDWCYDADSDDDLTPEDGGPQGVGRVVAWHSRSGEKVGAIQIPRSGWVKVQWQVTGYTRSYRMGTSEYALAELVFAAIPDQEEKTLKGRFSITCGVASATSVAPDGPIMRFLTTAQRHVKRWLH